MKRNRNSKARSKAVSGKQTEPPPLEMPQELSKEGGHSRRTMAGICAVLAMLVLAVFSQTLRHEFVNYDDDEYVVKNSAVIGGLSLKGLVWAFTHVHSSNWHPVTWLSHMLDCELYGLAPWGHHLTSVLLHAATAVLLFLALHQLTSGAGRIPSENLPLRRSSKSEGVWCSAFVAALFAIHPLRVESVAWVAERKDVLSGLFFMLTLLAYSRYARYPFSIWRYLAVVVCFALGLMSKPMLVTLPFALLLLDYWPLGRLQAGRIIFLEKLPLFLLSAASCVVTVLAQTEARSSGLPMLWRLGNALVAYVSYLGQTVWPVGLAVLYPYPGDRLPLSGVILSFLLLTVVSLAVFALRRKRPWFMTGWLWYLGMLVPVIGLMQVGSQAHADRYTYLPQIGLFIILTWEVPDLLARWKKRRLVCCIGATLVLATLACCTWSQTSHWRDGVTLWVHTLERTSGNSFAHNNLANALAAQGKAAEAIEHYQRALEIKPDNAEALFNLGNALAGQGKAAEAAGYYLQALEIKPGLAEAHNNLGTILAAQGRPAEAVEHYLRALETRPAYAEAHFNLANALAAQGKPAEAAGHYERTLETNPNHADAHNNLGNALAAQGKRAEAVEHYQRSLELKPTNAKARNNLGNALVMEGKYAEAVNHYRRALEIDPAYVDACNNLADSLAAQGKFSEAAEHYRNFLRINPNSAQTHASLGDVLASEGKAVEAMEHYRSALRIDPNMVLAHFGLAAALERQGEYADAIGHYTKAMEIAPEAPSPLNNLAWLLAVCPEASLRNGPKAVELARRANKLSGGGDPGNLDTLAAAYAEAGQFPEAVETARRALDLVVTGDNKPLAEDIRKRLRLYEAGKPYHEEARKR